ncbi:MAG TPA: hypothetical protein VMX94_11710 [Armatimonadota bacterium]|nr:hypothetical protein [Armatimonadota bacterium]
MIKEVMQLPQTDAVMVQSIEALRAEIVKTMGIPKEMLEPSHPMTTCEIYRAEARMRFWRDRWKDVLLQKGGDA